MESVRVLLIAKVGGFDKHWARFIWHTVMEHKHTFAAAMGTDFKPRTKGRKGILTRCPRLRFTINVRCDRFVPTRIYATMLAIIKEHNKETLQLRCR